MNQFKLCLPLITIMAERFTRRDFLNCLGLGLGALALSSLTGEKRELPAYLPTNTLILDFAPETTTSGIIQEEFPNNEEVLKKILGDKYLSEWELKIALGLETINSGNLPQAIKKYPEAILARETMKEVRLHTPKVVRAMDRIWNMIGIDSDPYVLPIQNELGPGNIKFTEGTDSIRMDLSIEPDQIFTPVRDVLKENPGLQVLNLSFQMGVSSVVYDLRSGEYETIEAYRKERSYANVPKLVTLCKELPELLVVAAGGNESDDILKVRGEYESKGEWPENLILTADWNEKKEEPSNPVYGVDFYLDSTEVGSIRGSSITTGIVSAVGSALTYVYGSIFIRDDITERFSEQKSIRLPDDNSLGVETDRVNVLDISKLPVAV
ncbi:MAG: hypothetical protein UT61_C0033G0007 [Candidatus Woesebacteria bacterium GW2011_GWA1_39_8]|uniref:Uncharacterized protein n=2 Tax=Candidatus Woeseibacteriota TaxID=1752722 RepID=A0A0G0S3S9_9BACT|nr:MAG: hypothetical protein UT61_C0033G0007 [Candidatus Woesebacteria bacterium GW2011_GWA1_39_8]